MTDAVWTVRRHQFYTISSWREKKKKKGTKAFSVLLSHKHQGSSQRRHVVVPPAQCRPLAATGSIALLPTHSTGRRET